MKLFHESRRRRTSLLAAGAIEGREREEALRHLDSCEGCRREHAASLQLLRALSADPVREAEVPVPVAFLVSRVQARLDALPAPRGWRPGFAVASLAAAALVAMVVTRIPLRQGPAPSPTATEIVLSGESLERLERNVAREQAARYLSDAQDVLVTVAASPRNCERESQRVDVAEEARRSRELLAKKSLLVEMEQDAVASARPVIEDVNALLREVAQLESCARAGDLDAISREISRQKLLMKIDLMTRELTG
jgi:hypothetical protein